MCIHVSRSSTTPTPWNPITRVITIPAGLSPARSLIAVQAVLSELGIDQPADGARCFCGDAVAVCATALFPVQRNREGARLAS
jgi:hypothetical protein